MDTTSPDPIERLIALANQLERGAAPSHVAGELRTIAEELNAQRNPQ